MCSPDRLRLRLRVALGALVLVQSTGSWRSAVDGGRVDTIGAGFLTPLGRRTDIEFRLSFDDSDSFGSSTVISVFLYCFGGS